MASFHPWPDRDNATLLGIAFVWGLNYTAIKLGLREMAPLTWATVRFVVAAAIALGWMRWRRESVALERSDWLRMFVAGGLCYGGCNALVPVAMRYTTGTNGSLIMASSPVMTAILAWAMGWERFWPAKLAGVALAFAGLALLVTGGGQGVNFGGPTLVGDILMLVAAVGSACYPLALMPLYRKYSPLKLTTWTFIISAALMGTFALGEPDRFPLHAISWLTPATVLYAAVFSATLAQVYWNTAVAKLGATQVVVYLCLPPLVAFVVGRIFLAEAVSWAHLLAMLVIFFGIYLVKRPSPANLAGATPAPEE